MRNDKVIPPLHRSTSAAHERRRPRRFLARAYGVKRSFTGLTDSGFAAARERLESLPNLLARYTPEELARIQACEYDGPWSRGHGAARPWDLHRRSSAA